MKAWMIAAATLSSIAGLAAPAVAETIQEWPIRIEPMSDNEAGCNPGTPGGRIQVKEEKTMSLVFPQFPEAIWVITLAADGSFDGIAKTLADIKGTKLTVPKGNGPRTIETVQQSKKCGYRLLQAPV
jgi:hypothetical protein